MYASTLFLSVTALIAVVSSTPYPVTQHLSERACNKSATTPRALYFADNNLTGNSIYAVKVLNNGTLVDGPVYSTGGLGGSVLNPGSTNFTLRDALSCSHSLVVNNDNLYAVNSGSNTITRFAINPQDPTDLKVIGSPVNSHGDFPVSIAISNALNQLCVAHDGVRGGVKCFHLCDNAMVPLADFYDFHLTQTNPPINSLNLGAFKNDSKPLISSIQFSEDSTQLFATVLRAVVPQQPGWVYSFPVVNGTLSQAYRRFTPQNSLQLFLAFQIPHTQELVVLDGKVGTYHYDIQLNDVTNSSAASSVNITGGIATCWIAYSETTDTIFITDAGTNRFVELNTTTGVLIENHNVTSSENLGILDIEAYGNYVYAVSPSVNPGQLSRVQVMDVSGGPGAGVFVQDFVPQGLGFDESMQGIALYI
ncbi:hypothetical protein MMC25_004665 [Agyrium rufum]|nr:hypothetical protein [Agyrium rufum]